MFRSFALKPISQCSFSHIKLFSQNTINSLTLPSLANTRPLSYALPFFCPLASNRRCERAQRPGTRKASRVPPHAYCRALLIGPDPGGMKYKNRNKAPLPVPGEMLRYRIRDSASAPSRARKQTQLRSPSIPRQYYRRSLPASSFFSLPLLSNVIPRETGASCCRPSPPRARTSATAGCLRFSRPAGNSAIIDGKEGRRSPTLSGNLFLRDKLPFLWHDE